MATPQTNETPSLEPGFIGPIEATPVAKIINDAHDQFLALISRMIGLEYGMLGAALKKTPQWEKITQRKIRVLDRLHRMGSDEDEAKKLCKEMRKIDEAVNNIVDGVNLEDAIAKD
ncbi:MAG: hypothetical protein AAF940_05035 [Pseudomonadota bacterium]